MKKLYLAVLTVFFLVGQVHATGGHTPTPPPAVPSNVDVKNSATSGSVSGAKAGATADAVGTGQAEAAAEGGRASAGGGSVSDSSSSRLYVLPAPIYAPPMAAVSCPNVQVSQKGGSFGWNFISGYDHSSDTADCTLIQMRNAKVETCQYADAKQIEDQLTLKYLPGFKITDDSRFMNLSPSACAAVKAPPAAPAPVVNYIYEAAPTCAQPHLPKKRGASKPKERGCSVSKTT